MAFKHSAFTSWALFKKILQSVNKMTDNNPPDSLSSGSLPSQSPHNWCCWIWIIHQWVGVLCWTRAFSSLARENNTLGSLSQPGLLLWSVQILLFWLASVQQINTSMYSVMKCMDNVPDPYPFSRAKWVSRMAIRGVAATSEENGMRIMWCMTDLGISRMC